MSILFYTYASGFCMAINNSMRDFCLSQQPMGKGLYHDEWCIWNAHFYGKVVYSSKILTKYRRHSNTLQSMATVSLLLYQTGSDVKLQVLNLTRNVIEYRNFPGQQESRCQVMLITNGNCSLKMVLN